MSGTGGRFYDENEAEEILRLAVREGASGKVDKDRLLSMAAELGISPEAVERAEAELQEKKAIDAAAKTEQQDRLEYRSHRRRDLWSNIGTYVTVNLFLVGIWVYGGAHGGFWPFWVIFPWGFGIFPRIISDIGGGRERDFQRWRRKKYAREASEDGSGTVQASPESLRPVLDELAERGETSKLTVIRELRERTGVGLSTAKQAVEEYAAAHDDVVW